PVTLRWTAELTDDVAARRLAWRSKPGGPISQQGEIDLVDAPGGRGTEVHVMIRYQPPLGAIVVGPLRALLRRYTGVQLGTELAHEFMGGVVEVGSQVETLEVGDHVVVLCAIACGRCWYCTHDQWSLCDNSNPVGSAAMLDMTYGHAGGALFGYSHLYGGYWG